MKWIGILAFVVLAVGLSAPSVAQDTKSVPKRLAAHEPTRIRVYANPRFYPGPDAVRQCVSWLATEYRPSGTVIVPREHCWWERG